MSQLNQIIEQENFARLEQCRRDRVRAIRNAYRRFVSAARRMGATHIQRSHHGCGRVSAQGFDDAGQCVIDWNLS